MAARSARTFTYDFPRPALTADVVLLTREARPRVLLIRRKKDPFAGAWALPGGFVEEGETLVAGAKRELEEETGVKIDDLEQLYTSGNPGRDPRGWTVTVAFLGRVDAKKVKPIAADDATEVKWFALEQLPEMAFDHAMILNRAQARLTDRMP